MGTLQQQHKLDARVGTERNVFCSRADTSRTRYVAQVHFLVGHCRTRPASRNSSLLTALPSGDLQEAQGRTRNLEVSTGVPAAAAPCPRGEGGRSGAGPRSPEPRPRPLPCPLPRPPPHGPAEPGSARPGRSREGARRGEGSRPPSPGRFL